MIEFHTGLIARKGLKSYKLQRNSNRYRISVNAAKAEKIIGMNYGEKKLYNPCQIIKS